MSLQKRVKQRAAWLNSYYKRRGGVVALAASPILLLASSSYKDGRSIADATAMAVIFVVEFLLLILLVLTLLPNSMFGRYSKWADSMLGSKKANRAGLIAGLVFAAIIVAFCVFWLLTVPS